MTSITDLAYVFYLTHKCEGICFTLVTLKSSGVTEHTQKRNHYNQRDNVSGHLIGTVLFLDTQVNHRTGH